MIKLESVYFTDDGQFFKTRNEAERHDLICKIEGHILECKFETNKEMIDMLLNRFRIEERYDYVAPPKNAELEGEV
jgi:hypothetical protein